MHNPLIIRGLSKFSIFYTLFTINYCFRFVTFWYTKSNKTKLSRTQKAPPRAANLLKPPIFAVFPFSPQFTAYRTKTAVFVYFDRFLFNNNIPPARRVFSYSRTLAAPAILAPFPSTWRRFSSCPVLVPVQRFNAIKQPPFRFRFNSSISFRVI